MKSKFFGITLLILLVIAACNHSDQDEQTKKKQVELNQLLKDHNAIQEKINKLQSELGTKKDSGMRVAVEALKPTVFNHFIEVQARVDADQSVDVFAEGAGGMITQVLVKEGQSVGKGQTLAKLDDKVLQESLKATQSNLDYVKTMYEKQKALWEQKLEVKLNIYRLRVRKNLSKVLWLH